MKLYDPVFGEYTIPEYFLQLLNTPVIQRLRWIRLSNISSLNFPLLAGISRFSHSVGVFVLAARVADSLALKPDEKNILMSAALMHDAGIPPLGHLMEEALTECGFTFDHEESLKILLLDEGDRFAVLPDGRKNGIFEALQKIGVSGLSVFETIKGCGKLGKFITSNIDLDNIDNVIRVYNSIFSFGKGGYLSTEMAIEFFKFSSSEYLEKWERTRAEVYHKLMFALEDFAQKATIKRLLRQYLTNEVNLSNPKNVLSKIQFLNDEEMTVLLSKSLGNEFHLFSGENDRIVNYGWVNSIEKQSLLDFRERISSEFAGHYIDFIPDKRIKYSSRAAQPDKGAFLGIFASATTPKNINNDKDVVKLTKSLIPNFIEKMIPDLPGKNQLSLF